MKELRKALLSFIFAGIFTVYIYKLYNERPGDIGAIQFIEGYMSVLLVLFGFYQLYKFYTYLHNRGKSNLLTIEYSKEVWRQFVKEETKRRLIDNIIKIKKTLMIIPLIILCLLIALGELIRKDVMLVDGVRDSSFQEGILTILVCIVIFTFAWYGIGPLLFYLENINSRNPFLKADKNYVLLNGELYQWKNEKDNHIVERKILEGTVVQIKYQTSSARFNDVTFRFLIPPDKKAEVTNYLRML